MKTIASSRVARRRPIAIAALRPALMAALLAASVAADEGRADPSDLSPDAVRTHLHLHALTNHNGPPYPGSLQWHVAQAAELPGDDFIWWTEHGEFLGAAGVSTYKMDFRRFVRDGEGDRFILPVEKRASSRLHAVWDYHLDGYSAVEIENGAALLKFDPGREPGIVTLEPRGSRGTIRTNMLTRPLVRDPVVRLYLEDTRIPDGIRISVLCYLSYRWAGEPVQPLVRFDYPPPGEGTANDDDTGDGVLVIPIDAPAADSPLECRLARVAEIAPELAGYSISRVALKVKNDTGRSLELRIRRLEIDVTPMSTEKLHDRIRRLRDGLVSEFGVSQAEGEEVRWGEIKEHFCLFNAAGLDTSFFACYPGERLPGLIRLLHQNGGRISFAHILGTVARDAGNLPKESKRETTREAAFKRLRETGVFGVDFLEVGYRARGNGLLEDYLLLWDALAASGHEIVGIGASDAHGSIWDRSMTPNSWATWIYGPARAGSLLDSLVAGRAYFGDMARWDGQVDFSFDGHRMGDKVPFTPGTHRIVIDVRPENEDREVRMTVVPLDQKLEHLTDLRYTMKSEPVDVRSPYIIELEEPSLIRLEVHAGKPGEPREIVALSNPIWVVPD